MDNVGPLRGNAGPDGMTATQVLHEVLSQTGELYQKLFKVQLTLHFKKCLLTADSFYWNIETVFTPNKVLW